MKTDQRYSLDALAKDYLDDNNINMILAERAKEVAWYIRSND